MIEQFELRNVIKCFDLSTKVKIYNGRIKNDKTLLLETTVMGIYNGAYYNFESTRIVKHVIPNDDVLEICLELLESED